MAEAGVAEEEAEEPAGEGAALLSRAEGFRQFRCGWFIHKPPLRFSIRGGVRATNQSKGQEFDP